MEGKGQPCLPLWMWGDVDEEAGNLDSVTLVNILLFQRQ
jgi:hypothetical protein